ncbi:MAG: HEPN domain-containing protein, partial [Candidatus Diapherotrites archaeon]|nr:HEPN domain-containing protein [Candidatus Diapherotrites archaeon]
YMAEKKAAPPDTHSLVFLGKELKINKKFFPILKNLTTDFIASRYPDITFALPYEEYTYEIANEYIKQTAEVLKWIAKKLKGKQKE